MLTKEIDPQKLGKECLEKALISAIYRRYIGEVHNVKDWKEINVLITILVQVVLVYSLPKRWVKKVFDDSRVSDLILLFNLLVGQTVITVPSA